MTLPLRRERSHPSTLKNTTLSHSHQPKSPKKDHPAELKSLSPSFESITSLNQNSYREETTKLSPQRSSPSPQTIVSDNAFPSLEVYSAHERHFVH
mmetsp:Transcript_39595/g.48202  ORF Transcript_39595/g.48202 Transcript_39595/m.48202 type:complete len:96 (+) Transcript_39595:52-339(+)